VDSWDSACCACIHLVSRVPLSPSTVEGVDHVQKHLAYEGCLHNLPIACANKSVPKQSVSSCRSVSASRLSPFIQPASQPVPDHHTDPDFQNSRTLPDLIAVLYYKDDFHTIHHKEHILRSKVPEAGRDLSDAESLCSKARRLDITKHLYGAHCVTERFWMEESCKSFTHGSEARRPLCLTLRWDSRLLQCIRMHAALPHVSEIPLTNHIHFRGKRRRSCRTGSRCLPRQSRIAHFFRVYGLSFDTTCRHSLLLPREFRG
jgi:hypothetical protein